MVRWRDTVVVAATGVTERERDVLALVVGHLTNAEIAERLSLSVRTVESHVSSLIRKLQVPDRRALARRADQLDLLRERQRPWPSAANLFVGRRAESAELRRRLTEQRLVTVTGPGGVGKTRLTTHVVHEVAGERADGAWFVDLSQVTEPDAIMPAIAAAVGVMERPGQSLESAVSEVLRGADGVLLVDNCEHLLPRVEARLTRLVGECPRLTVAATSRAPLRSPYEWVFPLPGLPTDDAVRLFCTRAEAAGGTVPDDRRTVELCERLEGMALAIELAAARYPGLGLDGLGAGLADPLALLGSEQGDRRSSLRAMIGWSVDLLDDEARAMFAALCVFAAPFTVAAAHALAAPDRSLADAARVLATLADQHLLYAEPGNPTMYHFQEVVRQYAADLLGDEAADVMRRHGEWATAELATLAAADRDDKWYDEFDRLAVEVRAALSRPGDRRALGEHFAEELVRRGRLEEAQRRFEVLAATAAVDASDRVHLLRLAAGAAAARLVGDDAMRLLDEAAAVATEAGDATGAADALAWSVIFGAFHPGIMANPPSEQELVQRLAAAIDQVPAESSAAATVAVAEAACLTDDDPRAESVGRRAADLATAAGLPVVASAALDGVCAAQLVRGDYAGALAAVKARGELMDLQPLTAATAYPFNDYLLMGCEISLSAGDLPGARRYAERLEALPCYRDYVHPALARRLQVDLLTGDLAGAVARGERFLVSWDRAGRHRAATLAVGAYALALVHGLLGDDDQRGAWESVTAQLLDGPVLPGEAAVGWAPTCEAWLLLHRGQAEDALAVLRGELDDDAWRKNTTALMWRPWYAAASAEAAALASSSDVAQRLQSAAIAAHGNPVAEALVYRAQALSRRDLDAVASCAPKFEAMGAAYQRERSLHLSAR